MYSTDEWKFVTEKRTAEAKEYLDDLAFKVISKQMRREQAMKDKLMESTVALVGPGKFQLH